ncbi:MAG: hypothetical protein JST54_27235, partial [Deltaproteobacteria bacterium]|nr:hypothetical protein [Deltaproteobacteria bacterium]
MSRKLGELLVAKQLITSDELEAALRRQFQEGHRLGSMLVAQGRIRLEALTELLHHQLNIRVVAPAELADGATRCRNLLSLEQIQRYQALPVRTEPGKAHVAFCTPQDAGLVSALQQELGVTVVPTLVPQILLVEAAYRLYGLELAGPRAPGTSPRPTSSPAQPPAPAPEAPSQSHDDIVAARAALFGGPGVPTDSRPPSKPTAPMVAAPSRPMPLPPPIAAAPRPGQPPVLTPAGALAAAARAAGPAFTPPSVPVLTPAAVQRPQVLTPQLTPSQAIPSAPPMLTPAQAIPAAPRPPVSPPTVAVNPPAPTPSLAPMPVNALRPNVVAPIPLTPIAPPPVAPTPVAPPEDDWTRGSGLAALLSNRPPAPPVAAPPKPASSAPPVAPTPPIQLASTAIVAPAAPPLAAPDVDVEVELAEPEEIVQAVEVEPDVTLDAEPQVSAPVAAKEASSTAETDTDMVVVVDLAEEEPAPAKPVEIAPLADPSSARTLLVTNAIDLNLEMPEAPVEAKPPEPVVGAKSPEPVVEVAPEPVVQLTPEPVVEVTP